MNTDKKAIRHLAKICAAKGIEEVVFSPGSRCAPMVIAFNAEQKITCRSVVDERSAAFIALGMAQRSRKTVGLVCTSGSAALNYAPAISEAFYQEVPLLILTADRPAKWIDQGDMQTIRQNEVYRNYCKGSFVLNTDAHSEESDRMINEAIDMTQGVAPGPVHINIPLDEPLYGLVDTTSDTPLVEEATLEIPSLEASLLTELKSEWGSSEKRMILVGLMNPNPELNSILEQLAQQGAAVFTETTSNLHSEHFLPGIDRVIDTLSEEEKSWFQPDLVVTCGGYVVSKKVKLYLRKYAPKHHWHIHPSGKSWDTFEVLNHAPMPGMCYGKCWRVQRAPIMQIDS